MRRRRNQNKASTCYVKRRPARGRRPTLIFPAVIYKYLSPAPLLFLRRRCFGTLPRPSSSPSRWHHASQSGRPFLALSRALRFELIGSVRHRLLRQGRQTDQIAPALDLSSATIQLPLRFDADLRPARARPEQTRGTIADRRRLLCGRAPK
jgi:hypothetical protein